MQRYRKYLKHKQICSCIYEIVKNNFILFYKILFAIDNLI